MNALYAICAIFIVLNLMGIGGSLRTLSEHHLKFPPAPPDTELDRLRAVALAAEKQAHMDNAGDTCFGKSFCSLCQALGS